MAEYKITVANVENFCEYLTTISKVVTGCKFEISSTGCLIRFKNSTSTIRGTAAITSVTCPDNITFCLNELTKMKKVLELIRKHNKVDGNDGIVIKFDGANLSYKNKATRFNFVTVKQEIISSCIDSVIKTQLDDQYGIVTSSKNILEVLSLINVTNTANAKVYLYKTDDEIIGEIDNKSTDMTESIGIPVAKSGQIFERTDKWGANKLCFATENFRALACLPVDQIVIAVVSNPEATIKNVVRSVTKYEDITVSIISTLLKE